MKKATEHEMMERIRLQQKRLAERLNKLQARQRKQERKDETRQKVLLGAFLRAKMDKDPDMQKRVLLELQEYLTRDIDRVIFGFELRGDGTVKDAANNGKAPKNEDGDKPIAAAG